MTNFAFGPPFGFNTPWVPTDTGPLSRTHSVSGDHVGQLSWSIQRAK